MNFLTSKQKTPMQYTLMFLALLPIAYAVYFTFVKDYGSFLMMISSGAVASMFDMHVINTGSYLADVKLISNIGLQNSVTHEVAYAELLLPKLAIDKIMIVITNSALLLALTLLLVRSFKVLAVVLIAIVSLHVLSVSAVLTYFIFEVSPQSSILTSYLQAIGVTQLMIDTSYVFSGISYFYIKYFMPLAITFYVWESYGYGFAVESKKELEVFSFSRFVPAFMFSRNEGVK